MTKADWELELEKWGRDTYHDLPDEPPPLPSDPEDDNTFERGLYYDADRPVYWWVRYYHVIKHFHSGDEELTANTCRILAALHNSQGGSPQKVWDHWLWNQLNRATTPHRGITITTYRGEHDGAKVIHIDTDDTAGHVRVNLNDGPPLFDGDPEKTSTTK